MARAPGKHWRTLKNTARNRQRLKTLQKAAAKTAKHQVALVANTSGLKGFKPEHLDPPPHGRDLTLPVNVKGARNLAMHRRAIEIAEYLGTFNKDDRTWIIHEAESILYRAITDGGKR